MTLVVFLAAALPSAAQIPPGGDDLGSSLLGKDSGADKSVVAIDAQFTAPAADKPGRLFVTATIDRGWHIYSITQPTERGRQPDGHEDRGQTAAGVRLSGPFKPSPAPTEIDGTRCLRDLPIETHEGTVTWYAPIELAAGRRSGEAEDPGNLFVRGVRREPCCIPPQDVAFTAALGRRGRARDACPIAMRAGTRRVTDDGNPPRRSICKSSSCNWSSRLWAD